MVLPEQAERQTKGGIALPDMVVEQEQRAVGTVVAVGPCRRFLDTGATAPMLFEPGQRVAYSMLFKNRDRQLELDGTAYLFLDASDILGAIE